MRDFARSDDGRVQRQLDRLAALAVPQGRLGLETIRALLTRLGNPQDRLPPVFHVAGTNGKGSTCAFLRAMLEASGLRVHVTTSPHLVRYNERIRLAGTLIADDALARALETVLDAGADLAPSFFEVTIAAALCEFARVPADACVIEVGLGGRFDATNVMPPDVLAACGIASLGIDHERFLLAPEAGTPAQPLARIAFEKAGIAKPGVPLIAMRYPEGARHEVERAARQAPCPLHQFGKDWTFTATTDGIIYRDDTGELHLPFPTLAGSHQHANAALAVAMIRHQRRLSIPASAMAEGIRAARWPARLQRLGPDAFATGRPIWIDGGHNPDAGAVIARHFAGKPIHLVVGMLANKDAMALLAPMAGTLASITAVPVPGHECHPARAFGPDTRHAPDVPTALARLPADGHPVLIAGSLYLAGEVLRLAGDLPD